MNHITLTRCPATHNADDGGADLPLIKNLPDISEPQTVFEGVESVSSDSEAMEQIYLYQCK